MQRAHTGLYDRKLGRVTVTRNAAAAPTVRRPPAIPRSVSRTVLALALLLALSSFNTVGAQDPDGMAPDRGFHPNGSYAIGDIESVSLAGGNMNYSIPLAALPAGRGGRLSPAVSLIYNSKLYDTQVRMCLGPNCTFTYTQTELIKAYRGGWSYGTNFYVLTTNRAVNYIDGAPPTQNYYKYRTEIFFPDGSSHQLRPSGETHSDDYYPVSPGVPGSTRTYYSTDATYFRVQFSADGTSWTAYFADGTIVNFDNATGVQTTTDGNGNSYTVQNVTLQNGNPATVIADQLGRQITVEKPVSGPHYVRVKGVSGADLVTTINWGTTQPQGKKYLWKVLHGDDIYHYKTSVPSHTVVTSISLPNGLSYQFEYNSGVFDPLDPTKSVGWGELCRATLPTGAVVEYAHSMDNRHGNQTDDIIEPKHVLWGHPVSKRLTHTETYDGLSTPRTDIWGYAVNTIEDGPGAGQPVSGAVTAPDGGMTTEYFYTNTSGSPSFNKDGLTYKTVLPDGSVAERVWAENMPSGGTGKKKNFYVKTEFNSVTNSAGTLVKTAIKDFTYDKNGNLLQLAEYDWVNYADVPRDAGGRPTGAIPASAAVRRVTASGFYNQTPTADSIAFSPHTYNQTTAPNLRAALQWSEVRSGFAEASALSRTEFDYDNPATAGNLTAQRSWDSTKGALSRPLAAGAYVAVSHQYDGYGNRTFSTDSRAVRSQLVYGAVGGFTGLYPTETRAAVDYPALRRTTATEYDFWTGLVTRTTDVDNNVSASTTYDNFGRPVLVRAAEGKPEEARTATSYDDAARRVVVRADLDAAGDGKLVSVQHFDQLGRLRLARRLEDASTQDAADEAHGVKVQTRYRYSGAHSYVLTSQPYRASTSGGAGEPTRGWSCTKSDRAGRVVEVQTFMGSGLPAPWGSNSASTGTVVTANDAEFTTVTDQAGKSRRSRADALGRLVRVDEPDAATGNLGATASPVQPTSYTYDALGNLRKVDQGGQFRFFMYDSLSRLVRAKNPEQGVTTHPEAPALTDPVTGHSQWSLAYSHDDNGNLVRRIDARNVKTTYGYDELNRSTTADYSDATPDVTRHYDNGAAGAHGKGRLWKTETQGASGTLVTVGAYDALGRPLSQTQQFNTGGGWGSAFTTQRTYDRAGNVLTQTYPSGRSVAYDYDAAGRLADFRGALGGGAQRVYSTGVVYDEQGRVKVEQYGTDTPLYNRKFYNSRGQLAEIRVGTFHPSDDGWWNRGAIINHYSNAPGAWGSWGGGPDNNGNLLKQEIYIPHDEQRTQYTNVVQEYNYDALNRLTSVYDKPGNGAADFYQLYSYDLWGNRTIDQSSWNVPKPNFTVSTSTNRLQPPAGYTMTYDAAGNLTFDDFTGAGTRAYDAEGRLTSAQDIYGQTSAYAYDADGRRVRRSAGSGAAVWQVYGMGGELLAEYAPSAAPASPQKEYGYRGGELLVTAEAGGAGPHWLVADHLGTPRMVLDRTGSLAGVRRHDYLPFGEEVASDPTWRTTGRGYVADSVRQQFTGHERDDETGLDFAQARHYASGQGRFTSIDPVMMASERIADPQQINLYGYVRNNPLKFVDPTGEKATVTVTVNNQEKTATVTIEASFAVYAAAGQGVTQQQLNEQKDLLKKQIEEAYANTFTEDGVTYTVSAKITVTVVKDEKTAIAGGRRGTYDNIAEVGNMYLHVAGEGWAAGAAFHVKGEKFDRMKISLPTDPAGTNLYSHEFTHGLGSDIHLSPGNVGSNDKITPSKITKEDFNHLFGPQATSAYAMETKSVEIRQAPTMPLRRYSWRK
jgi:RHS repeat-associated protein